MTPEQLASAAISAIAAGTRMTLVRPKGHKAPAGFPRGELLCENYEGSRCYSVDPVRVLAWLRANGLISVEVDRTAPDLRQDSADTA